MRFRAAVVVALLLTTAASARADVAGDLHAAADALQAGDYQHAADLAGPIASAPGSAATTARADLAEAWRVYGLSLFFLNRRAEAEIALLRYLELDVDAHLDPVLVAPEAIVFFEDVRARHAGELESFRPRPHRRRYLLFALVPAVGQWQNGDDGKAWLVGSIGVALLATNVTSFLVIRDWCGKPDHTCDEGRQDSARTLRSVNHWSFVGLAGVVAYGMIDGYLGLRRERRRESSEVMIGAAPTEGGMTLVVGGSF